LTSGWNANVRTLSATWTGPASARCGAYFRIREAIKAGAAEM